MSVSKLESLPNEILIEILEKYINGIDLLNSFAFQLNRRFDALIAQCQRLRFDFIRCHKDDFRLCMGLLPAYVNQIEVLALSEQNAPGQIHGFLSFFPSFDVFQHLRKLYFHLNTEVVQPIFLEKAFVSLSKTMLHTIAMKITKAQGSSRLRNAIVYIFRIPTLKKLSLSSDAYQMDWSLLNAIPSAIEHLTIHGISCDFEVLESIVQCTPALRYLDITVKSLRYYGSNRSKSSSKKTRTPMPMLHTAIFNINGSDEATYPMLEPYLRVMPSLRRLEIKVQDNYPDMSVWEIFFKTSLPNLVCFNMESNTCSASEADVKNMLESVQTPFWLGKKNFNVIIKEFLGSSSDLFLENESEDSYPYGSKNLISQWWVGPQRNLNDNLSILNQISGVHLSTKSCSLLQHHYLNNVKHLAVQDFNDTLFELITTHIDCSQIKHLVVSALKPDNNKISSLLPYMKNIISVQMTVNQLSGQQFVHLKECKSLKFLDVRVERYSFNEDHILIIANMFPNLEHLNISTDDVRNIPMLQTYLSRLHSLTFLNADAVSVFGLSDYEQKMLDVNLRRKTQFLFHRESNCITVWMDQSALQDPYWCNTRTRSRPANDYSMFDPQGSYLFQSDED